MRIILPGLTILYILLQFQANTLHAQTPDEKIIKYTGEIEASPKDYLPYFNRGIAYYEKKDYDAAIRDYNEVMLLKPGLSNAYYDRALAYHYKKQYDLAISDYTKSIQINPNYADAFYSRALSYERKGLNTEAIKDYTSTIQLKPDYVNAIYYRGLLLQNSGDTEGAFADFTKVISFKPEFYGAYYYRGVISHDKRNYDAALSDYNTAARLKPNFYDVYYSRGMLHLIKNEYDSAIADNSKAIELQPDYTGYFNRGNTNFNRGDHEGAVGDYKKALEFQPDSYDAHYSLGAEYYNHGEHDLAIAEFFKITQLYRDSTNAQITLILSYIANKDFTKAKEVFDYYTVKQMHSYLNTDSNYSFLLPYVEAATKYLYTDQYKNALPLLLTSLNNYASSIAAADKYAKYDYGKVLNITGWVYQHLDTLDKAAEYYRKALVINPQNEVWLRELSGITELMAKRIENDKAPPEIILLTPKAERGQDIDADIDAQNRIFVSGYAKDKSGISWVRVNGVEVENLQKDGYFSTYVKDVANKLIIQAQDKQGNLEPGKEFRIGNTKVVSEATIPPIPANESPNFHAVLIACSNYSGVGGWNSLPSTIDEAKALKKVLISSYGFSEKNIVELYDKSKDDITTTLSGKLESLTKNDNLVILYSGHGTSEQKGSQLIGYWVPLNASSPLKGYISNSTLDELIAGTKARHILIMSDACFSGAMRGNALDAKKEEVLVPVKQEYQFESRRILTSGGLEKVPGNSEFIKLVIEALQMNSESFLSEFELFAQIFPGVKNKTKRSPILQSFGSDGNNGGQFFFVKRSN